MGRGRREELWGLVSGMEQGFKKMKATKAFLELISKLSKVTGSKINTQKSTVLVCPNSEHVETQIKNIIVFLVSGLACKELGIHHSHSLNKKKS